MFKMKKKRIHHRYSQSLTLITSIPNLFRAINSLQILAMNLRIPQNLSPILTNARPYSMVGYRFVRLFLNLPEILSHWHCGAKESVFYLFIYLFTFQMILILTLQNLLEESEVYLWEEFLNKVSRQGSHPLDSFSVYIHPLTPPPNVFCDS